jgi:hypothetical protein
MSLGYHYVALGGLDAKHIGSQSREWFRYETSAAADINHVQAGQGPCCARVPLKQHGQALVPLGIQCLGISNIRNWLVQQRRRSMVRHKTGR